ncbi:cyclopropane fatty-acyl-phospholipid synthase-like methyltransferase [Variovorax boronicumulans]|uniref:SAM-dependent methyltransferase n=1 Tax=Variovorax boronicumulans TaxID=436515 RepID=UPI0027848CE1|nr:class I SAM-dependent methyltransferase [Variovorax boronicumulans]MDP9913631.1 cyclopropane fatty-acyl-phospholipid synthase-like methyltransferase [Variovorax boronicumulans]
MSTTYPDVSSFKTVTGASRDPYQDKVVSVYTDTPEQWQKAIGHELWYQFGVYDQPKDKRSVSLDEAGARYLDRQLELAGIEAHSPVQRVLDIGCGWGAILRHLARRLPQCQRLDGVNISPQQLEWACGVTAQAGLAERIHLYRCNAKDIEVLPDPEQPYDLAILRGSIIHFSQEVLDAAFLGLARRMRSGGKVIISESLYNVAVDTYQPAVPDPDDRAACAHRKTPQDLHRSLRAAGFVVQDTQVLPSNDDAIYWFGEIRRNIDAEYPDHTDGAFAELREVAVNWSVALYNDKASVYSIVAQRP